MLEVIALGLERVICGRSTDERCAACCIGRRMPYLSCVCRTIGLTDKADRPLILRSVGGTSRSLKLMKVGGRIPPLIHRALTFCAFDGKMRSLRGICPLPPGPEPAISRSGSSLPRLLVMLLQNEAKGRLPPLYRDRQKGDAVC